MPIQLSSAIQYVTEHGTVLERARMLRILMDVEPSPEAYQKLLDSQNPDGGFPSRPKPGSASSADSTLTALWQFDELGMLSGQPACRALEFLRAVQRPDGGLDENAGLPEHDLPPWIRPGEESTRLYLTGYAAYWLGAAAAADHPAFLRAVAFLAARQQPEGRIPGYMHNNWLAAAAFLFAGEPFARSAARALEFLLLLARADWADSQLAWALDCLTRAGLAPAHPFARFCLDEIAARQAPDGSWASEDGPAFATSATVGAIKVLKHHGQIDLDDLDW